MKNIKVTLKRHFGMEAVLDALKEPYENENTTEELLDRVVSMGHESVLEHAIFQFKLEGFSRGLLLELERHRLASMTVKSTRYTLHKMIKEIKTCIENNLSYRDEKVRNLIDKYFVNYFEDFDKNNMSMSNVIEKYYCDKYENLKSMNEVYDNLKELNKQKLLKERVQDYLKGFLHEMKRSSLLWTINLRSLRNFLKLRMDKTAHFEIRLLANLIKDEIEKTDFKKLWKSK